MTIQTPRMFVRLAARVRPYAIAVALVAASAHAAAAAPLTLTYSFDMWGSDFAKFDTTQGTLLGIDISLQGRLAATNPFAGKGSFGDTCGVVFSGGTMTVSAAGTPTLLEMAAGGSRTFFCEQHESSVGAQATTAVDPTFFGAFSSAGGSPMTLNVTINGGTATFTHGSVANTTDAYWLPFLHEGLVTYTYCAVGEDCSTPPPPPPPSVPEPGTAVLVAMGLAGTLRSVGRRRFALTHTSRDGSSAPRP